DASLRWAGNSMTTNGESVQRSTIVVSVVRSGEAAKIGSLSSTDVEPAAIPALVAASQNAARSAPDARDAMPLLTGSGDPHDWDQAPAATGADAFGGIAGALSRGFEGSDKLYGFAHHIVETTYLATSTGLRRRF